MTNRRIFGVNSYLARNVFLPVSDAWHDWSWPATRTAAESFLNNLDEPRIFANNLLQGRFALARDTAGRFVANTVVGVAGLIDVATAMGLNRQSGDFGQTLYAWGMPAGPYLVVPLLGPSNPRDLVGFGADLIMDPFTLFAASRGAAKAAAGRYAASLIDTGDHYLGVLKAADRDSLDLYAKIRSMACQHRAWELRHGEAADIGPSAGPSANSPDPD